MVKLVLWIDEDNDTQAVVDIVQACTDKSINVNGSVEDPDGNTVDLIANNAIVKSLCITTGEV